MTLVCCQTTLGVLNIAVHPAWAPLGAQRVLQMVENGFFNSEVAFFRALAGFLVQFGIAGDPKVQAKFDESHGGRGGLPDDPQWLPPGPPGREINGVTRFQKGYLSYAGWLPPPLRSLSYPLSTIIMLITTPSLFRLDHQAQARIPAVPN